MCTRRRRHLLRLRPRLLLLRPRPVLVLEEVYLRQHCRLLSQLSRVELRRLRLPPRRQQAGGIMKASRLLPGISDCYLTTRFRLPTLRMSSPRTVSFSTCQY
jgi:hypothetical protein